MNIGSLDFPAYVARRLRKDGLGFLPCELLSSQTDRKTYIKSPIVKTKEDLLAYCHELGHCKSKQKHTSFSYLSWSVNADTIYNEINAWDWALRYVRRLGVAIPLETLNNLLKLSLGSYIDNAEDEVAANAMLDKFDRKFGCSVAKKLTKINIGKNIKEFDVASDKYKECKTAILKSRVDGDYTRYTFTWPEMEEEVFEKKSDKWKPWHDLQENASRKDWRNK